MFIAMGRPLMVLAALTCGAAAFAPLAGQTFQFDTTLSDSALRRLAVTVLAAPGVKPEDRFRLQLVAGRGGAPLAPLGALDVAYAVFERAGEPQARGASFVEAAAQAFRATFARLDDRTAALAIRTLIVPVTVSERAWQAARDRVRGRAALSREDAVRLLLAYARARAYGALAPLAAGTSTAQSGAARSSTRRSIRPTRSRSKAIHFQPRPK